MSVLVGFFLIKKDKMQEQQNINILSKPKLNTGHLTSDA